MNSAVQKWACGVAALGAGLPLQAADPALPPPDPLPWVFSLLPKSLQKNPRLDVTVVTDFTDAGRKVPAVDPARPAHYLVQSGGYHRTLHAPAGGRTLPPDAIDALVRRSLAERGYLPASAAAPATLVIVYFWGRHSPLVQDGTVTGDQIARNLLDRAALVGGEKFKQELTAILSEATAQVDAAMAAPTRRMEVDGAAVAPVLGADQLEFMSPVARFREHSSRNEFLLEQVAGDVVYVVVSAYDRAGLEKQRRVLLWRTRMTVAVAGVAENQALPTLITAAAPYLGRETAEAVTLTPRMVAEGRVDVGPLTIEDAEVGLHEALPPR